MKQDPLPLFDARGISQTPRDDRRAAETAPGPHDDVDAEVQRFLTLIAAGRTVAPSAAGRSATAAPAAAAPAATAPAAKTSPAGPASVRVLPRGLKIVGVVVLGLVCGALALKALRTSNRGGSAGATRGPQGRLSPFGSFSDMSVKPIDHVMHVVVPIAIP